MNESRRETAEVNVEGRKGYLRTMTKIEEKVGGGF